MIKNKISKKKKKHFYIPPLLASGFDVRFNTSLRSAQRGYGAS